MKGAWRKPAKEADREATPWRQIFISPVMWWINGQQFFRAAGYVFYIELVSHLSDGDARRECRRGRGTVQPAALGEVFGSLAGGVAADWVLSRTGSLRLSRQGLPVVSLALCAGLIVSSYFVANVWLAVLIISLGRRPRQSRRPVCLRRDHRHWRPTCRGGLQHHEHGGQLGRHSLSHCRALAGGFHRQLGPGVVSICRGPPGGGGLLAVRQPQRHDRAVRRRDGQELIVAHVDTPQSGCRFGVARCDITPAVGIYHRMWGAATHDRSTGVHRPLTATALVFQALDRPAGVETEQVVVAVDHCLFWPREMEQLIAAVCRQTGLVPEQVSVAFSHTHAAGLMDTTRTNLPGGELIPPYLDQLGSRVSAIVEQARKETRLATICYGTGHCSLATHRDFWDPVSKQFVCGFNPDGVTDETVLVARITGADGQPLATMVNYACHPTTLAWENTKISPDYIGAMREVIEHATGVPCAFIQGASGDIGPREGFVGDVSVADRNGRQLGHAALAALEALPSPSTRFEYAGPVVSGATLGAWTHVPLDDAARKQKSFWRMRRWSVDLPYRPELPTEEQTRADRERWLSAEHAAEKAGEAAQARDCHAMVERMDRNLVRLATLAEGQVPAASDYPVADGRRLLVGGGGGVLQCFSTAAARSAAWGADGGCHHCQRFAANLLAARRPIRPRDLPRIDRGGRGRAA